MMFVASTAPAASTGALQTLQQQRAQRSAEQAEVAARSLQQKAREAQTEADQAQENARTLKVKSEQADGKAGEARQNLESLRSLDGTQQGLQDLRASIAKGLSQLSPSHESVGAVLNAEGQSTGTLINVTA